MKLVCKFPFQQVFLDLYGSRLAVIGAIEGNAPAAGCMLALSCDYRIMSCGSGGKVPLIGLMKFNLKIPPHARYASKMLAREQYLQELHDTIDEDVEAFKGFVLNEQVQKNLGAYLQSLKVKKK